MYKLPSPAPAEVNTALKVTGTHYQPIDGKLSAADFCAEFAYRPVERKPGRYARQYFANRVGKTKRTIFNYQKRVDVESIPNIDVEEITSAENLPDEPEHKPVHLSVAGKEFSATKSGYERAEEFKREYAPGHEIKKVTRQANTYRLKDRAQG